MKLNLGPNKLGIGVTLIAIIMLLTVLINLKDYF